MGLEVIRLYNLQNTERYKPGYNIKRIPKPEKIRNLDKRN